MLASINKFIKGQKGFTIVELNIAFTVLGLVAAGLMTVIALYIVNSTRTGYLIEMTNDSQNLLRTLSEELRYGAGVRSDNTIADENGPNYPADPEGGWNTSEINFVIITAIPALKSDGEYIINEGTGSPYLNEYVYYRQGNLLYRRILAHPDAVGNTAKTSCPASAASSLCPADRAIVDNLNTINFTFYDQDNVVTTFASEARSIKIDLNLSRDTFGNPINFDNSIRTTLRNKF